MSLTLSAIILVLAMAVISTGVLRFVRGGPGSQTLEAARPLLLVGAALAALSAAAAFLLPLLTS